MADDGVIIRELATLSEAMRGMQATITEVKGEMRADRTTAQQSRAKLYNRLEALGNQHIKIEEDVKDLKEGIEASQTAVKADIERVNQKVGDVKKVTDTVTRWQLIAIGIIAAGGVVTTVIGLIIGYWARIRLWLP